MTDNSTNANITFSGNGFTWNGQWVQVRPSAGDDDGPPTGVREPRRPHPNAPAGAVALVPELAWV